MQRIIKILFFTLIILFLLTSCMTSDFSRTLQRQTLINRAATVKIINVAQSPNFFRPWEMKDYQTFSGTGAILKDGSIITNAHVVTDSRYLAVIKENDPKKYEAKIEYIGHECDLAILKVDDPAFYQGTTYLDIAGQVPDLNSVVTTYGYPMGGDRISITKGVVSRIEIDTYVHQWKSAFLQVQTDAAINPGNSGGPVVQNGKIVGIAFQGMSNAENIGYMIPVPIIEHFLKDIGDGTFDGFPDIGIIWSSLENQSLRKYLKVPEDQSGVYIKKVVPGSSSDGFLEEGDAILSVDGVPIADDGSIPFANGRIMFNYLIDSKQVGDPIALKVLRQQEISNVTFKAIPTRVRIPSFYQYEIKPRYFIYGGIVFQSLCLEYMETWDKWWKTADPLLLYYFRYSLSDDIRPDREEFVVINKVLPDSVNTYITDIANSVVDSINGMPIRRLEDIPAAIGESKDGYIIINLDGNTRPIVLDKKEIQEAGKRIQSRYGILKDRELN